MTGVLAASEITVPPGSGGGYSPTYSTHTSGSGTETIPTGPSSVTVGVWSGGGGGGYYQGGAAADNGGGGGSGGYSQSTFALTSSDWGKTLTYVVGAGGAAATSNAGGTGGTSSTANGTFATSVSISVTGGTGGTKFENPGTGGTASGGQSNVNGNNGGNPDGASPLVGLNGRSYGAGGDGALDAGHLPTAGLAGAVVFYYT